jgi:diguanylate cyclase (GGDEF)-like protein
MSPELLFDEAARLDAVRQYSILDGEAGSSFDELTLLASQVCRTPIALITLVDEDRVLFKSRRGLSGNGVSHADAFCAHAIRRKDLLIVPDAGADARFKNCPLVSAYPYAKFYAGMPLITPAGHAIGTICVMDSISRNLTNEQKESLAVLARQTISLLEAARCSRSKISFANHDSITSLPNQELFKDRLQQAVTLSRRHEELLAVMLVSLDRFKAINDTLGYVASDQLLAEIAARVVACVRESDTVARFGNDEFALLLTHLNRAEDAAKVAQAISASLSSPFSFADQELFVTASIGISLFPYDARDTVTLLKHAGTALNRSQEQDGNNYQFYTSGRTTKALKQLVLENNLRPAIEHGEFFLQYQPQVDMESFQVVGAEALVRWQHPGLGLLHPGEFIQVAEESGLIVALGEWVLRAACAQSKTWQDAGFEPFRTAVNLSARQFQQPRLVEKVGQILSETGFNPRYLELELTEGSVMKDPKEAIVKLEALKAMGLGISIDDFGTGYSSLSYLKRFPIDTLKIDRSFVKEIDTDADDAEIVAAIIKLAHALRLNVIAEGVETEGQLHHLRRLGCDEVQGFLFGKPQTVQDFTELLTERLGFRSPRSYDTNPIPDLATVLQGQR